MSNVMSMKQIRNKPSRSAFDLSQRNAFTAKVGELLPVMVKECLPGDKFKFGLQSFTRTMPVNSAAFTRIREYYDYFFVPYRLLWRYSDQFFTDTLKNNAQYAKSEISSYNTDSDTLPYFTRNNLVDLLNDFEEAPLNSNKYIVQYAKNFFGYKRSDLMVKLLQYLGYGSFPYTEKSGTDSSGKSVTYKVYNDSSSDPAVVDIAMNPFKLFAYQKICQDYFRNTQWEDCRPYLYNMDYADPGTQLKLTSYKVSNNLYTPSPFDLRYCNWNKDLFMGVLPSAQYGDTAVIADSVDIKEPYYNFVNDTQNGTIYKVGNTISVGAAGTNAITNIHGSLGSTLSILALRQAEALQKYREISLSGKTDYKDQIEKHFGISVPEVRSNLCTWIGGTSDNLDISEVVNTALGDTDSEANIKGKGVGVMSGHESFEVKEHGIIMCIYHAVPIMDYVSDGYDALSVKTDRYQFALPEFDKVGMEQLPYYMLSNQNVFSDMNGIQYLGYVPRYIDYKTAVDACHGNFTDQLKYWLAPIGADYLKNFLNQENSSGTIDYSFFLVNPSILDYIFVQNADGSWQSDQLLVNSYHDVKVVRNLDYNGLPY